MSERAKSVSSFQDQIMSDEELFDFNKFDYKKLGSYEIKKIIASTLAISEALFGMPFYKYQKEFNERIIYSLIADDGETLGAEFARQGGKSSAVGGLVPGAAVWLPLLAEYEEKLGVYSTLAKFRRGLWVGIYGPDYDRAALIGSKVNIALSSNSSKKILTSPRIGMTFPGKLLSYTGNLPRNSKINVKSANKRVSIEGDTYHLCITDETQEISDYVLKKSISPFLASTNGTMVHIGSAYPQKVYFYDICKQLSTDDIDRKKVDKCYFRADYKICQKYNSNYKKYIIKEKKKLGENSDEFRMSYELFWPIEKGMFVTEDLLLGQLAIKSVEPGEGGMVVNYDRTNMHAIGIDIGKILDSTVITVMEVDYKNPIIIDPDTNLKRHRKHITNWLEIQGDDYDSQFYQICDFMDNFKWNICVIDATGVGQALYDRLRNRYSITGQRIVGFVYNKINKSDGFSLLYKELLAARITFPSNPNAQKLRKYKKFVEQMTNLSKNINSGFLVVEHVDEKGHDDYPNSLMLCNLAAEEEVELEVVQESAGIFQVEQTEGNNFWKQRN